MFMKSASARTCSILISFDAVFDLAFFSSAGASSPSAAGASSSIASGRTRR